MKATGIVRRIVEQTGNRVLLRDTGARRERVHRVNHASGGSPPAVCVDCRRRCSFLMLL